MFEQKTKETDVIFSSCKQKKITMGPYLFVLNFQQVRSAQVNKNLGVFKFRVSTWAKKKWRKREKGESRKNVRPTQIDLGSGGGLVNIYCLNLISISIEI